MDIKKYLQNKFPNKKIIFDPTLADMPVVRINDVLYEAQSMFKRFDTPQTRLSLQTRFFDTPDAVYIYVMQVLHATQE